jgi:hypothetical protein
MSTISRLYGAVVALAVLFGTSTAASAGFIFTAQNRFVTGQLGGALGSAGPQTFTASDFGLFDAATSLTIPTYGGAANQHQRSELLPLAITVAGDTLCILPAMVGTGSAFTRSYTSVGFDLTDTATEVTLSASGTASSGGIPIHEIKLIGPAPATTPIVYWDAFGSEFPAVSGSRSTSLTLSPGSYQFIVDMQSSSSAFPTNNHSVPNFNVALAIPEPGSVVGAGLFALTTALMTRRRRR